LIYANRTVTVSGTLEVVGKKTDQVIKRYPLVFLSDSLDSILHIARTEDRTAIEIV